MKALEHTQLFQGSPVFVKDVETMKTCQVSFKMKH